MCASMRASVCVCVSFCFFLFSIPSDHITNRTDASVAILHVSRFCIIHRHLQIIYLEKLSNEPYAHKFVIKKMFFMYASMLDLCSKQCFLCMDWNYYAKLSLWWEMRNDFEISFNLDAVRFLTLSRSLSIWVDHVIAVVVIVVLFIAIKLINL